MSADAQHDRDARIIKARDLSGLAHEMNVDRLAAFLEVLDLLERLAEIDEPAPDSRSWGEPIPAAWLTVKDREGTYWDRLTDGRWQMRGSGISWSASHVQAECGPLKPVVVNGAIA